MPHKINFYSVALIMSLFNFASINCMKRIIRLQLANQGRVIKSPDESKKAIFYVYPKENSRVDIADNNDKSLLSLKNYGSCIKYLVWSPCSTRIITLSVDHVIRIWDVETGHCLAAIEKCESLRHDTEHLVWTNYGANLTIITTERIQKKGDPFILFKSLLTESQIKDMLKNEAKMTKKIDEIPSPEWTISESISKKIFFVEPAKWLLLAKKRQDIFDRVDYTGVEPDALFIYLKDNPLKQKLN